MSIANPLFQGFLLTAVALTALPAKAAAQVAGGAQTLDYAFVILLVFTLALAARSLMLRQQLAEKTRALAHSQTALARARLTSERALAEHAMMLHSDMVGIARVADGKLLWANSAFEAMFGYRPGEWVGVPTSVHYPCEASYQALTNAADPVMAAGKVFRSLTEFKRCDGASIWVELSGAMLDASTSESMWIFLDTTERQHAQAVRQEAAQRLQKLSNRLPGVLYQYLLRPDGSACLPYASEAIRQVLRVNPEDVNEDATAVLSRNHPDDAAQFLASIQASARDLTPWQHEYRMLFDDGSVRWLYGNSVPERLDDDSVLWHGLVTDITERKAADDRLRQLSRSVEQAPVSIVTTDLQGNILYANPSFTRNTGYTLEEATGQNPRILKSGLTPPETYAELWGTVSTGGVWQGELHNRRKDGTLFIERAVIAPVLDAEGHISHYVAVKEDITQRKQADLALQNSLREKVALLNEVHHRVKNNLQVITSLLRLEVGRSAQPDTRSVLKDMQSRIYAMALLHESLYRSGTFASVELGAYLKQLATQTFRTQSGLGGDVRLLLEMSAVNVGMDQAAPCGLLVNELLSNCLKHGFPEQRSGQVVVSLQPSGRTGWWQLSVRDTGVGLPGDFEARRTQSLGLQLASDLARQIGGQLNVGPGPGATFSVVFHLQVFPLPD
ncbi:PAS domain S-box protein [Rhodoferax antarcticus]|uniref:PAS domain S-box protein n=1 Tax=Rhodoferax antarcticus TaxID=81479 RepID=UPI0022258373|nr:PAS domain S-box protein [Rhodoferax antarcticus]MCW2313962.1 PAS domain S-box-containing protein [Rhodoferax antarcticus]